MDGTDVSFFLKEKTPFLDPVFLLAAGNAQQVHGSMNASACPRSA